jgi:hypothetical protein
MLTRKHGVHHISGAISFLSVALNPLVNRAFHGGFIAKPWRPSHSKNSQHSRSLGPV